MAAYEILLLNTAIPQIQAAQSGDTYVVPRAIAFSAALTLSTGTANGVAFLNGSNVLTTGSALTFDGTNLETTGRLILRTAASPSFAGQIGYSASGGTYIWPKAGSVDNFNLYDGLGNSAYQINSSYLHIWSVSGSEQMRLTSTGLEVKGNLVIGTAGKGIDFSANPSAAGMTSELLDDYEEGTWTATLVSSGGGSVTVTSSAKYIKIGNLVFVSVESYAVSTTGLSSGDLTITGLPFTCNVESPAIAYFDIAGAVSASQGSVQAYAPNSTTIQIYKTESTNANVNILTKADLNSSVSIRFNGTYTV